MPAIREYEIWVTTEAYSVSKVKRASNGINEQKGITDQDVITETQC